MVSMEIKDALALTASVCTALQFLAGVLVCRKYIQNGTTGSTSGLAFVICCASCVLWVRYGMLIGDKFIVYVNIFGMTLQAIYVSVFILYSVKKRTTIKQIVAALCALANIFCISVEHAGACDQGCVLSTFQLCVFLVYRNDQPDQELLV
ncbi:hypothetical protein KM043_009512 [Ampulex compressa]|nr:hypothetical protein KM043_009512 [Ampulex compressa]